MLVGSAEVALPPVTVVNFETREGAAGVAQSPSWRANTATLAGAGEPMSVPDVQYVCLGCGSVGYAVGQQAGHLGDTVS